MERPTPRNEEIKLDKFKYILSRTDPQGIIEYGNEYFVEISGYGKEELLRQPHNIIRHPDMPRVIFKLMWERLNSGQQVYAVVKNLAKDGRYYWVTTKFEIQRDRTTKEIIGYLAYRQAARIHAVDAMNELYAKLIEEEKRGGIAASEEYLRNFLKKKNLSYDAFIDKVINNNVAMRTVFAAMKKFFAMV